MHSRYQDCVLPSPQVQSANPEQSELVVQEPAVAPEGQSSSNELAFARSKHGFDSRHSSCSRVAAAQTEGQVEPS